MPLHIKNRNTERIVRELAKLRGIGITEAIEQAVGEALAADKLALKEPFEALRRRLQPLLDEMATYSSDDKPVDKAFFDEMWREEGLGF